MRLAKNTVDIFSDQKLRGTQEKPTVFHGGVSKPYHGARRKQWNPRKDNSISNVEKHSGTRTHQFRRPSKNWLARLRRKVSRTVSATGAISWQTIPQQWLRKHLSQQ